MQKKKIDDIFEIPEIGDQVMIGFEYHDPDFPFATGGMFHGNVALGGVEWSC